MHSLCSRDDLCKAIKSACGFICSGQKLMHQSRKLNSKIDISNLKVFLASRRCSFFSSFCYQRCCCSILFKRKVFNGRSGTSFCRCSSTSASASASSKMSPPSTECKSQRLQKFFFCHKLKHQTRYQLKLAKNILTQLFKNL